MFDVTYGLIDQLRHMHVIKRIDDPATAPLTDDQADVFQQPQLMRDRGLLHADRIDELGDRMRTIAQLREDQNPTRSRKPLHRVSDPHGDLRGHVAPGSATLDAVAHIALPVVSMTNHSLNKRSYHSGCPYSTCETVHEPRPTEPEPQPQPPPAMSATPALLAASAGVGFGHAILPDHWVPLAVVGRTRRYPLSKVARLSGLAGVAHVLISIVLGAVIIAIGLQFRSAVQSAQDTIIGCLLIATGVGFGAFELLGPGHSHDHSDVHGHSHEPDHEHDTHDHDHHERRGIRGLAAIMVPFGAAASPDLTILPVFLAATATGVATAVGSLVIFAAVTIGTIVVLTITAAKGGYQVRGEWLERWGNAITAATLIAIGVLVLTGVI
jgi:nickel/cobalt transporter (NicO) family protein